MNLAFEPEAREELAAATIYYAGIFPELAERFIVGVQSTIDRVRQFPNAGAPLERTGGCRRSLLSRFPYQLIYRVEADVIRVYAFAHMKRRPRYWRNRTQRSEQEGK